MTESRFKQKVVKYIKSKFPNCWILCPSEKWVSGVPDILCLISGTLYAIELKVGNNQPTKLQNWTLAKILMAGGHIGIARSIKEVDEILKSVKKGGDTK